jgi:hypothetical protein
MKLEYIPEDKSEGTPLVRLYDFDIADAGKLCKAFSDLASESSELLELHAADFIEAMNNCRLTLAVSHWDQGLSRIGEPVTFLCALSAESWDNMVGLTEPFTQPGSHRFQWLNATDVQLLLSYDGKW